MESSATNDADTIRQNPYTLKFDIILILSSIYTNISKIKYPLLFLVCVILDEFKYFHRCIPTYTLIGNGQPVTQWTRAQRLIAIV